MGAMSGSPQGMLSNGSWMFHGRRADEKNLNKGKANFLMADGHVEALASRAAVGIRTVTVIPGQWSLAEQVASEGRTALVSVRHGLRSSTKLHLAAAL